MSEEEIKELIEELGYKEFYRYYEEKIKFIEDLQQKVEQLEKELNQEKEEYAGLHKVLNNKEEEFEKENYNNVVEISILKRKVEQLENIRKEAIEYMKTLSDEYAKDRYDIKCEVFEKLFYDILNKGSDK